MTMDNNMVLPQKGTPDELDKIIYSMTPDRYGHCATIRSQNKYLRINKRNEIIKAVLKLVDASNAPGQKAV